MTEESNPVQTESDLANDNLRRGFLVKFAAAAIGGVAAAVPAFFAGGFFLTPLLKKKNKNDDFDGYFQVGSLSNLSPGGAPQAFKVMGTKKDAWTTYGKTALGAVYVNMGEGGELSAFNASCPHLGCSVNYKQETNDFLCPCHDSSFMLGGERQNEIPPRAMDSLEVEVRNDNEIWVKFENFRAGTATKIPV